MAGGFSWEVRSSTQGNWSSLLHTDNSEWNLGGKSSSDKGLLEGWLEGECDNQSEANSATSLKWTSTPES